MSYMSRANHLEMGSRNRRVDRILRRTAAFRVSWGPDRSLCCMSKTQAERTQSPRIAKEPPTLSI